MTTTLVSKRATLKAGTPMVANEDGVIVLDPNGTKSYLIDTTVHDGKACKFSGMAGGADVSYAALYALAKTAFPASFP